MRSTYLTTCGANTSRRWLWKRPLHKLSVSDGDDDDDDDDDKVVDDGVVIR